MPITSETFVASPFERVRYFFGQLLTQRDLTDEQQYHVMLRRLLQRELFGYGTVAGLRVTAAGSSAPLQVRIEPGLAFDPDGRELLLANSTCVTVVPKALEPQTATYLEGKTAAKIATAVAGGWGQAFTEADASELSRMLNDLRLTNDPKPNDDPESTDDPDELPGLFEQLMLLGNRPTDFVLPLGQRLVDYLFHRIVGLTFIGLRYHERGAAPTPAVLDQGCGDSACHDGRTDQGVCVVTQHETPFENPQSPAEAARLFFETAFTNGQNRGPDDQGGFPSYEQILSEYVSSAWPGLPPLSPLCPGAALPVVPIAGVAWYRFERQGAASPASSNARVLHIDQAALRPHALGPSALRGLVEALTGCQPTQSLAPRVANTVPLNAARLEWSGETATITMQVTGKLSSPPEDTWEVTLYEQNKTDVETWTKGDARFDIEVSVTPPGPFDTSVVTLSIKSSSGEDLVLPSGVYRWRMSQTRGQLKTPVTEKPLDGHPRLPPILGLPVLTPSGDGGSESFESFFYVP